MRRVLKEKSLVDYEYSSRDQLKPPSSFIFKLKARRVVVVVCDMILEHP